MHRTLEINKSVDLTTSEGRDLLVKDLAHALSCEGLGVHQINEGLIYKWRNEWKSRSDGESGKTPIESAGKPLESSLTE